MLIPILYGSQTGNGLFLANELSKSFLNSFCVPIDSFDLVKINDFPLVIFICSTHGDGQPPFNMVKFYNFLMKTTKLENKIFKFKSAVLGLGDSSYPKFNFCSRILIEKLKILGSEVIVSDFCNAQDANGMYDGFKRFLEKLLEKSHLLQKDVSNDGVVKVNDMKSDNNCINSEIQVDCDTKGDNNCINNIKVDNTINQNFSIENILGNYLVKTKQYKAKVISNKPITPCGYSDQIYELVLSIPEYTSFIPGDCISILPRNTIDLCHFFNFSDQEMDYLYREVDFYSIVHQLTFKELSNYVASDTFSNTLRDKLLEISQDYDLYHSYIVVPRRNILEVIEDFNLKIPFKFFEKYNKIQPRYFSFSFIDNCCHILYNIVEYSTYLKRKRLGLCTQYMKYCLTNSDEISNTVIDIPHINSVDILNVEIVKSNLYLKDKNLLFFATGTGVTLPRSVVHYFKNKKIVIFYGFRHYNKDQIKDFESPEFKNVTIHYASSRDDRKYIMDVYRENAVENIDDWLVFVSGNSRLNKEIRNLLREVHKKEVVFQSETW